MYHTHLVVFFDSIRLVSGFRRLRCLLAVLKFRAITRSIPLARLLPFPASFGDMTSNVANPASSALVPTLFRVVIASITTMANTLFSSATPGSEPPTSGCLHGKRCLRCSVCLSTRLRFSSQQFQFVSCGFVRSS